jgi:ABC-type branched-chain amino acid transport system, permease component
LRLFLGRVADRFGKKSLVAAREHTPVIAYPAAIVMLLIGFLAPLPTGFLEFFAFAGGIISLTNAILMTLRGGRPISKNSFGEGMDVVAAKIQAATPQVAWVMFAIVVALPFVFPDRYVLDVSILILTYIMLGWGLNIIVGLAGLLDLGYVAFYAVGAYLR